MTASHCDTVSHHLYFFFSSFKPIAKNVVLAGVKSVTIHDPDPVEIKHLSSQVCFHEYSSEYLLRFA